MSGLIACTFLKYQNVSDLNGNSLQFLRNILCNGNLIKFSIFVEAK